MDAAHAQQLVAGGHFHQNRQVTSRRHRHANQRHLEPDQFIPGLVQSQPIVLERRIPPIELHHQLDPLRGAGGRDAEQVTDVDQAQAAHFHVVTGQFGTRANDNRLGAPTDFHRVVGDQPVAADDQIQRALALADAAVTNDQDTQAEDVEQDAVDDLARREAILENGGELADGGGGRHRRAQNGDLGALALLQYFGGQFRAAGNQQARQCLAETFGQGLPARVGGHAFKEAHFAEAEQQDASGLQVLMKTRQRETGFLDIRAGDVPPEPVGASQQLDR